MNLDELHADPEKMYAAAVDIVRSEERASVMLLQRRLAIGFNRACYLIERMEREGLISAPNNVGVREVIATRAA